MDSSEVKRLAKRSQKESLENNFLAHWLLLYPQLPTPLRQHRFCPGRKFAWDFCWDERDIKLAVEIQGGAFMRRSGHNTAYGQSADYEKWRIGASLGWLVLPFNTIDMKHPEECVEFTAQVLCRAKEIPNATDIRPMP